MSAKVVQLQSFVGGTSRLVDSQFLGSEESINMYTETINATDKYTQKMLKSLEGFSKFANFNFSDPLAAKDNNKRFFLASKSPASSINGGDPVLYAVVGCRLWRIYKDGTVKHVGAFGDSSDVFYFTSDVYFAETSGDPAYLVIVGKGRFRVHGENEQNKVYYVSLDQDDDETQGFTGYVSAMALPDAYDHNGKISPSQIASLNYRLILNDEGHDYIYWSELNKPNGVEDGKAFYKELTRYTYTKTDGTQVTSADNQYYPPAYGTYQTGTLQTESVWMAALNNVKADFKADNIKGLVAVDSCLFAFGSTTYQIYKWQNSENAPFVSTSKTSAIGLRNTSAMCVHNNAVYFLGYGSVGSNSIFKATEAGVEKISNTVVEQRIAKAKEQEKSFLFSYVYKGHTFIVVSFVGSDDNFTLCYDATEGEWHTRADMDEFGNVGAWGVRFAVSAYGTVIFSGISQRSFFKFDENSFVDINGLPLLRSRTTGIKFNGGNDIIAHSLELVTDNGQCGKVQNPKLMLQVSFDGGFTWSNEKWITAGRVGAYNFRPMWSGLGCGPKIAFRIMVTDAVPFNIATAYLTYSPCGGRIH